MKKDTASITETLKCTLTNTERLAYGITLADKNAEYNALEDEKKRITSDFGAKIQAVEAQAALLGNAVRSGYEYRPVLCSVTFGEPEAGKKTVVRNDTWETVGTYLMTGDELQRHLDFEKTEALQ